MTVILLTGRIDRQFQMNHQRHVLTGELTVKIERLRECFAGSNSLPSPSAKIAAAWDDLPNTAADTLPMSMMSKWTFLPAPPPTPTGLGLDEDPISNKSFDDAHCDSWVDVDGADTPTPDVAAFEILRLSPASDDESTSRRSQRDQPSHQQTSEERSLQSNDSSDPESASSESSTSTPVGFWNMVRQWHMDYRVRGTEAFTHSLIAFGAQSTGTAQVAAQIARGVAHKLSSKERKRLESAIRFTALGIFKKHWCSNDRQMTESPSETTTTSGTPYHLNLASFIGSSFKSKITYPRDIHFCLSLLSEGEKSLDRLCTSHALLAHANDKLCKRRFLQPLLDFQKNITARDEAGEYLWATTPYAKTILADIVTIIERWMVTQSIRRDRSQQPSCRITFRNRAVGPRLRNTVVVPPPCQEQ